VAYPTEVWRFNVPLRSPKYLLERIAGTAVTNEPHDLGLRYDRVVVNRAVLTGTHILLAAVVTAAYANLQDFTRTPYWSRVGLGILVRVAPPITPYLVSLVHSLRLGTSSRPRLGALLLLMGISSAFITSLLLGHFGSISPGVMLAIFGVQTVIYVRAANVFLGTG
jgi:hypothetical protein